jgi:hypothetical protein
VKVRVVFDILKRRLVSMGELVNSINNGLFTLITPEEWEIITETIECTSPSTQGTTASRRIAWSACGRLMTSR